MPLIVTKTPNVHITATELRRLEDEYEATFRMYIGTPPDFEEWAIKRIQSQQKELAKEVREMKETVKCPICGEPYHVYDFLTANQTACPDCIRKADVKQGK